MLTLLAFGFVPGGGFALSDHKSFNSAIPHRFIHVPASMAHQTYRHADFSPTAIALAAEENWPTLTITAAAHRPSCRAISAALAGSPAPRPSHKFTPVVVVAAPTYGSAISTAPAASPASRPSHKVTLVIVIAAPTSAVRPPCKATSFVVPAASPAPRPSRKVISAPVAATIAPRHLHDVSSAIDVPAPTLASRPLQKAIITVAISASKS
ncbi:hypothetical protein ACLOJK_037366, partial [Asimina triloba]